MFAEPQPTQTPDTDAPAAAPLADYQPVALRARSDGWTAERQRKFLAVLAETGCISDACIHAGVSSRSAYRLRQRPDARAFADAWDDALRIAAARLVAIAFDRAIKGGVREFWRGGELIGQTRGPSDKLLVFLLQHILPRANAPSRMDSLDTQVAAIRDDFPQRLATLIDNMAEMVPLETRDFYGEAPGDQGEDV
jgi:hypothetical protein